MILSYDVLRFLLGISTVNLSPFDRAHTTSYSTLIETMRLTCDRQTDVHS